MIKTRDSVTPRPRSQHELILQARFLPGHIMIARLNEWTACLAGGERLRKQSDRVAANGYLCGRRGRSAQHCAKGTRQAGHGYFEMSELGTARIHLNEIRRTTAGFYDEVESVESGEV